MIWARVAALVAVLAAMAFAVDRIYRAGWDAAMASIATDMAEAQRAAFQAAELASRKEAARLAAEASRAKLEQELEDAALADPVTDPACLPLGRVLRLNAH